GYFNPKITVSDGVSTTSRTFQWTINYSSALNDFLRLPLPDGGTIELDSNAGTVLSASIHLSPDPSPPGSIQFPFGFVTFSVVGFDPSIGATSLDMIIRGPS